MISVIIPVFNCEDYLYLSLKSVLKQTFTDLEILCIDDCSTDSSLEILNYFANKDSRIKIFKNYENKGLGYTRNKGLKHATGEYIFFLDGDDWISFNTLKELHENAKLNGSDLVFYKLARINNNEFNVRQPSFDFSSNFDQSTNFNKFTFTYKEIKNNVLNTSFSACLKLYKKSFLDNYDDFLFPENLAYEDVPFHVKVILRASKISFVPKFFYVYSIDNQESIIHDNSNIFDIFEIIDMVEIFLNENNFFEEFKNDFHIFKILQILQYLNKTFDPEYFKLTKKTFEEINHEITHTTQNELKTKYLVFWNDYEKLLKSNSIDEYIMKRKK